MTRLLRTSWALAAALLCLSPAASADIKIKTRSTVMGHTTESTVYIKGARERTETSFMGSGGMVTIMQCDQKRYITISGNRCMVTQLGGETSCPSMPAMGMGREMPEAAPKAAPRKGGTVTITATSTDTGERQDMFGYKARHIKTSMSMESTPDACNQSHVKMETDGWYASLSATLSCSAAPAMACGGGRAAGPGCRDRIVMKGGGMGSHGYPLKQTTTITSDQGTFTTTTEVVELTTATLDPPLFDAPPDCAMMGGQPPQPEAASEAPAPAPAPQAAPSVAPKTSGVVRVGVVKLQDKTAQNLPTENLRINLMSEITRRHMEAVPLDAEAPQAAVVDEARQKQCDYILYTTPSQLKEPGSGGLAKTLVPRGVLLDPEKFQALLNMTLYKMGKPLPEIKELPLLADAPDLGVNAVMAGFEKEADKVAEQVEKDAHPSRGAPAKTPAKRPPPSKPK